MSYCDQHGEMMERVNTMRAQLSECLNRLRDLEIEGAKVAVRVGLIVATIVVVLNTALGIVIVRVLD